MTAAELKTIVNCKVSFSTVVTKAAPIEFENSSDFYEAINAAVGELKEDLSDLAYKKFEQLIVETLFKIFPDDEYLGIAYCKTMREGSGEKYFLMLSDDNQHAPLSYTQQRFDTIMSFFIQEALKNAIVEFYTFTNSLPSVGQTFSVYAYERVIQQVFKDYQQLHDIIPGSCYYLNEWNYEERQCFDDYENRSFGQLNLNFCRYGKGYMF